MLSKADLRKVFAAYAIAAAEPKFKERLRTAATTDGEDVDEVSTVLQLEVISGLGFKYAPEAVVRFPLGYISALYCAQPCMIIQACLHRLERSDLSDSTFLIHRPHV
jgi:hypothetical protein